MTQDDSLRQLLQRKAMLQRYLQKLSSVQQKVPSAKKERAKKLAIDAERPVVELVRSQKICLKVPPRPSKINKVDLNQCFRFDKHYTIEFVHKTASLIVDSAEEKCSFSCESFRPNSKVIHAGSVDLKSGYVIFSNKLFAHFDIDDKTLKTITLPITSEVISSTSFRTKRNKYVIIRDTSWIVICINDDGIYNIPEMHSVLQTIPSSMPNSPSVLLTPYEIVPTLVLGSEDELNLMTLICNLSGLLEITYLIIDEDEYKSTLVGRIPFSLGRNTTSGGLIATFGNTHTSDLIECKSSLTSGSFGSENGSDTFHQLRLNFGVSFDPLLALSMPLAFIPTTVTKMLSDYISKSPGLETLALPSIFYVLVSPSYEGEKDVQILAYEPLCSLVAVCCLPGSEPHFYKVRDFCLPSSHQNVQSLKINAQLLNDIDFHVEACINGRTYDITE